METLTPQSKAALSSILLSLNINWNRKGNNINYMNPAIFRKKR
jgi:hypothetical protein